MSTLKKNSLIYIYMIECREEIYAIEPTEGVGGVLNSFSSKLLYIGVFFLRYKLKEK